MVNGGEWQPSALDITAGVNPAARGVNGGGSKLTSGALSLSAVSFLEMRISRKGT
jgi:hypothetical protein